VQWRVRIMSSIRETRGDSCLGVGCVGRDAVLVTTLRLGDRLILASSHVIGRSYCYKRYDPGRPNQGGMTRFASWEMLGVAERCCYEVRSETRRCVKMRLRQAPAGGIQRSLTLLSLI